MKLQTRFMGLLLCCHIVLASFVPAVAVSTSVSAGKLESPERLLQVGASDGTGMINSMLEKTKQIKAYSLDTTLCTFKGNKQIIETGKLFFKNPDLVRFEVVSAGKRSGAVVVRQSDGKIRGKMGGALSGIKITLSPDSKLLKCANDFSVLESDFASLLAMTLGKLDSKSLCLAGTVPGIQSQIIELVDGNGVLVSRMTVDSKNKLPEDWSIFQDNKMFSNAKFANLKILADLPDITFKLEAPGKTETPLIASSERGIQMSLAEYKLQMESIRLQEQSEAVSNALGNLVSGGVESAKMGLIAKALATISAETNSIMEIVLEPKLGTSSWIPGSKERLVIAASQIELLLSSVEKADVAGIGLDPVDLTKRRDAIVSCREVIAQLIDQTDLDQPNVENFEALKASLRECSSKVIEMHL